MKMKSFDPGQRKFYLFSLAVSLLTRFQLLFLHREVPEKRYSWLTETGVPRFKFNTNATYNVRPEELPEQGHLLESMNEMGNSISMKSTQSNQIPSWLKGTLFKNGPGLMSFGKETTDFLVDGLPMIRKYHVGEQMNISKRLLQTETLSANTEAKRFTKLGMKTTPADWSMIERIFGLFDMSETQNIQTIKLFGHFYATTELPKLIEYDPVSLATIGTVDLSELLPYRVTTMTPHPQYDNDGTLWNVGIAVTLTLKVKYVVFKVAPPESPEQRQNPWLNTQVVAEIPSPKPGAIPYFHSFFMTSNYLVIPASPWTTGNLVKIITEYVFQGKSFMDATMYWDDSSMLEFIIVDKKQEKTLPIRYVADPALMYHPINAYEENGRLILDAPWVHQLGDNYAMMNTAPRSLEELADALNVPSVKRVPMRYVLPLDVPKVSVFSTHPGKKVRLSNLGHKTRSWLVAPETVYLHPEYLVNPETFTSFNRDFDFGIVHPAYQGKKYRYAYGVGLPHSFLGGHILKIGIDHGSMVAVWEDPDCLATEPQFVPEPLQRSSNDTSSDDKESGVLVFVCHGIGHGSEETSLVILNTELQELGRFTYPMPTTFGIHGIWVAH